MLVRRLSRFSQLPTALHSIVQPTPPCRRHRHSIYFYSAATRAATQAPLWLVFYRIPSWTDGRMDERWTAGLPSFAAYSRACCRASHRQSGGAWVAAAAFGGLSASLAELLSSFSVLDKDAFTSSMHSAGVYENIRQRAQYACAYCSYLYVVCKTYRTQYIRRDS